MQKQRSIFLSAILAVITIFNIACGDDKGSVGASPINPKLTKKNIAETKDVKSGSREAENIGVTDKEIHIGTWAPQSGPAKVWGAVSRGMDIFFRMINEEGGIHGRKLVLHAFDDEYNPANTLKGVKELQEKVGIFAWVGGVGTVTGMAVKDYLLERGALVVGPASGASVWVTPPRERLFTVYPLYNVEAKALVRYAVSELGKKRFAVVYQNDEFGKEGLDGAQEELAKRQMKLVAEIPVDVLNTDMAPAVEKLQESNADAVLMWITPAHAIRLVGIAALKKYSPQFMATSACSDTMRMYKNSKGLWKGIINTNILERWDSKNELMVEYKKAFRKFSQAGDAWGGPLHSGFAMSEPFVEGLKRAGRDLNRKSFVKAMESIKNFQGIMGTVSYSTFDPANPLTRLGNTKVYLTKCIGPYKYKKLTDWLDIKWP